MSNELAQIRLKRAHPSVNNCIGKKFNENENFFFVKQAARNSYLDESTTTTVGLVRETILESSVSEFLKEEFTKILIFCIGHFTTWTFKTDFKFFENI